MIRLIATDLDGTLLNNESRITLRAMNALRSAMDKGCYIVLCSGRMMEAVLPFAQQISVNAPMIVYNGAMIYDHQKDEVLYAPQVRYDDAVKIARKAEEWGYYVQAYPGRGYYCDEICDYTRDYAGVIHVDAVPVHMPVSQWIRGDQQKLLLIDTVKGADEALAKLKEEFPHGAEFVKSRADFVEIIPEGVGKGTALEILAKQLGVDREEIAAFGDCHNDLPMLEYAGMGFAMENAHEDVRGAAGYIAGRNTEDGVARAIEDMLARGMI